MTGGQKKLEGEEGSRGRGDNVLEYKIIIVFS